MAKVSFVFMQGRDVFFPGETIQGSVKVVNGSSRALQFNRLHLEFKGFSKVNWKETEGTGDKRKTKHYTAKETYLTNFVDLSEVMRSQVYGGGSHLSPNSDYIVPFTFWIPSGLPGSTEEKYGFVRYSAKATLEVGSGFLQQQNATSIRHFSVTGIVDLNHFNVVSQPAEDEDESNLCCLWCASGPIVTRVKLDRTGFVPGEAIRCVVSVDNRSGNPFNGAKIKLLKTVTFKASGKVKHDSETIASVNFLSEVRSSHGNAVEKFVKVPPVPASHIPGCTLMDLKYQLLVQISPKGCHTDIGLTFPIKIGTIPLRSTFESLQPTAPQMMGNAAPPPQPHQTYPAAQQQQPYQPTAPPPQQTYPLKEQPYPPPAAQQPYPPPAAPPLQQQQPYPPPAAQQPQQPYPPPAAVQPDMTHLVQPENPPSYHSIFPEEISSRYPAMRLPSPKFSQVEHDEDEEVEDFEVVGNFRPKYVYYEEG